MKKILSSIMICCFLALFSIAHAQTTTPADKAKTKADKEAAKSKAKADKAPAKAGKPVSSAKTTTASPTKKDGTADMRYKSNKDAAKAVPNNAPAAATSTTTAAKPTPTPAAKPTPTPAAKATPAVVNPVNKSADKVVGTDAKGRTIYEGAKGGRYTLTAAGNKEYIKH